jgi:uncharacterized protein (DUF4213/DUF364 family)
MDQFHGNAVVLYLLRNRGGTRAVSSAILTETIDRVTDILGRDLAGIAVERAVVGLFFTGVKLRAGRSHVAAGTCATPREAAPGDICCPISAHRVAFRRLTGRPAGELMRDALSENGLARAVGIATLNALADLCWRRRPHPDVELLPNADAFEASQCHAGEQVVLVGAFIPFLKELKRRGLSYLVLERGTAMLKPEELPFYRPAEQAADVLPAADVLLITGSTLLTDTLEDLLALARPAARVTIVGPTVGMLPDAFLARGADLLGSVRITDPDAFLELIAEGGSAPHFLGGVAEKIVLARRAMRSIARVA